MEARQHSKNSGVDTLDIAESVVPKREVDTKSNII